MSNFKHFELPLKEGDFVTFNSNETIYLYSNSMLFKITSHEYDVLLKTTNTDRVTILSYIRKCK